MTVKTGANPHEYRFFDLSLCLVILELILKFVSNPVTQENDCKRAKRTALLNDNSAGRFLLVLIFLFSQGYIVVSNRLLSSQVHGKFELPFKSILPWLSSPACSSSAQEAIPSINSVYKAIS